MHRSTAHAFCVINGCVNVLWAICAGTKALLLLFDCDLLHDVPPDHVQSLRTAEYSFAWPCFVATGVSPATQYSSVLSN